MISSLIKPYFQAGLAALDHRISRPSAAGARELAFDCNPISATFLFNAYSFGILCRDRIRDELLDFNLQIFIPDNNPFDFTLYPTISLQRYAQLNLFSIEEYPEAALKAMSRQDAIDETRQIVMSGRYAYVYIDLFYIPNTWPYLKHHWRHELLIIGVDDEKKIFNAATYLRSGKFGRVGIPFAFFCRGFTSSVASPKSMGYCRPRALWSVEATKPPEASKGLDLEVVKLQLDDYLHSRNEALTKMPCTIAREWIESDGRRLGPGAFGLAVHERLTDYVRTAAGSQKSPIDLRVGRFLWEHKKMMGERLRRMNLPSSIRDEMLTNWQEVIDLAYTYHLRLVSLGSRKARHDFSVLEKTMTKMTGVERRVLTRVAACLN
jgi:hypothetical protein